MVFTPTSTTPQLIHGKLLCRVRQIEVDITFVYAFNKVVLRRDLWQSLSSLGCAITGPWMLIGDFNNVLQPHERINGRDVTMYETRDFLEICSEVAIEDLPFSRPLLMWNNGTVWSKLDRVMVNSKWLEDGLHGFVEFTQPGIFSDHAYAVTTLVDDGKKAKPPFRFFNMWCKHPEFHEVVRSKWEEVVHGTKQFQAVMKLRGLKGELKK